ncbi:MAG: M24 family metallopeptidase [Gemmatimonadetes bacterium]|nr:M24 family metallopeptidase [Gemmatimonadota bacterium]
MNHRFSLVGALGVAVLASPVSGQVRQSQMRDMREWEVKAEKMQRHLQPLMRQHGVDMWIIMSRENSPDPALELFGGYGISGWYGHRNAYIFYDPGEDRPLASAIFGTHQSGHMRRFFNRIEGYGEEGLAPSLRAFVHERDPQTIAINQSRTVSMADGLTVELRRYLEDAVGSEYVGRFVSSEPLFIDYVSRRTPAELEIAQEASWRTFHILRRALSNEVISPGKTTLMDLYWWVKDEWMAQDLEFNFPASFDIQRQGVEGSLNEVDNPVILPGDLLHVDFGVRLMGIVTDQQKLAYVLRPGETEPPAGLRAAFAQSVRHGEIIAEALEPGTLGRDVKAIAEERGRAEGIENSTYSHVQGNWVHGAGAWAIFDWPERYGDHPRQPVRLTEFWSIEYSVTAAVPEWGGQRVRMAREEDAWVSGDGVRFMAGPQRELWVIGQPGPVF